MRAVAAAILLFIINLIGMGIGPTLAGFLSDVLHPAYGDQSLRIALLCVTFLNLWAALHYFLAGPSLAADYRRAAEV
jgi:MFS family permease